mmetsp:Transcript_1543/g.4476  ORF Transcript_1543/g.4476 Transcript_1543/m.4476 type:complete len:290 (+) Transcript_1543:338-1207(+)
MAGSGPIARRGLCTANRLPSACRPSPPRCPSSNRMATTTTTATTATPRATEVVFRGLLRRVPARGTTTTMPARSPPATATMAVAGPPSTRVPTSGSHRAASGIITAAVPWEAIKSPPLPGAAAATSAAPILMVMVAPPAPASPRPPPPTVSTAALPCRPSFFPNRPPPAWSGSGVSSSTSYRPMGAVAATRRRGRSHWPSPLVSAAAAASSGAPAAVRPRRLPPQGPTPARICPTSPNPDAAAVAAGPLIAAVPRASDLTTTWPLLPVAAASGGASPSLLDRRAEWELP